MKRFLTFWIAAFAITGCMANAAERNNSANTAAQDGNLEVAIRAYQEAQVLEPDNPVFYYNAADALAQADNIPSAIEALEFAIESGDPSIIADAHYNLGRIYYLQDDYSLAIEQFQNALRVNPNHSDARFNLELALGTLISPTPTAMEMQVQPEDSPVDQDATPTPAPGEDSQLTPTPSPMPEGTRIGPTPDEGGEDGEAIDDLRSTPQPEVDGDLEIDQAERILDQIKLNADALGDFRQEMVTPPATSPERDW
ncbi:MAG: tetratricopeptide repeat protein [Anaerolineae bacterium]|nr:tetratricopeptide repeat protein [Anaerolineae bacterium]